MSFRLSERSACVVRSEIRNMSLECDRVGGINLSQGICDTPVPEVVRKAAQRDRMSKGEWVRRALRESLRKSGSGGAVPDALARLGSLNARLPTLNRCYRRAQPDARESRARSELSAVRSDCESRSLYKHRGIAGNPLSLRLSATAGSGHEAMVRCPSRWIMSGGSQLLELLQRL